MIEKELYIIRHGQTALNAQGIVQGKGVNAPLNELGRKQAEAFYTVYKQVPFERVYTSSLLRAIQTAERFIQDGVPHIADPDLDEIGWGDAEGNKGFTDHSQLFYELSGAWKAGDIHRKFPGGESPYEMQQRQLRIIDKIKSDSAKTILVATHGRYIRALMCTLTQTPLSHMDEFEHANLCLYQVTWHGGNQFTIEQHNNCNHLKELMNIS